MNNTKLLIDIAKKSDDMTALNILLTQKKLYKNEYFITVFSERESCSDIMRNLQPGQTFKEEFLKYINLGCEYLCKTIAELDKLDSLINEY